MNATTTAESLPKDLANAMRRFASSVTVISVRGADGMRNAITATSPTSISMTPPSMLFCIHRQSSLREGLVEGIPFCINILAESQQDVAQMCASNVKGEERFAVGHWQNDVSGTPYLADAEAAILCKTAQIVSFGSHDIVIGTVERVHLPSPRTPLVYVDGRYSTVAVPT